MLSLVIKQYGDSYDTLICGYLRDYTNSERGDIELADGMGVSYVHPV
jgi:hypothetical protein